MCRGRDQRIDQRRVHILISISAYAAAPPNQPLQLLHARKMIGSPLQACLWDPPEDRQRRLRADRKTVLASQTMCLSLRPDERQAVGPLNNPHRTVLNTRITKNTPLRIDLELQHSNHLQPKNRTSLSQLHAVGLGMRHDCGVPLREGLPAPARGRRLLWTGGTGGTGLPPTSPGALASGFRPPAV